MIKINYTEKGQGLHETVRKLGKSLVCVDNNWLADDPVVQSVIDNYPVSESAGLVVGKIKELAGQIISAKYPQWKQSNMIARYLALSEVVDKSEDVLIEMRYLKAQWEAIYSVRSYSNYLESLVMSYATAGDFESVLSFNYEAGWPSL